MNGVEFEAYLRKLQEDGYSWPNDYFAWEKPDGSLLMVGVHSTQYYHLLKYEYRANFEDYAAVQYGIEPYAGYSMNGQRYDPVENLAGEISEYKYLGTWHDPDILMDDSRGFSKVIACGRWELAKSKIPGCEKFLKNKPLDAVLSEAQSRAGTAKSRQANAKEMDR